jgi:hypothetical protein
MVFLVLLVLLGQVFALRSELQMLQQAVLLSHRA